MFRSRQILNESWSLLTESQQNVVVYSEHRLVPLLEQLSVLFENKLTPDQIESIFGAAEQVATDAGGNRTGLGKAKDIAGLPAKVTKQIDAAIKDVAKKAQDTTPVKNFDAQFEKLKQKIIEKVGGEDAKIVQMLKQYGQWAKDNPGKSMLILALLSAAASLTVGGGGAAAAIGFMFKLGNKLVQGEKLSTALGSGLYGAAAGWIIGTGVKWLTDEVVEMISGMNEADLNQAMNGLKVQSTEMARAEVRSFYKQYPWYDDLAKDGVLTDDWSRGIASYNGRLASFSSNGLNLTSSEIQEFNALKGAFGSGGTLQADRAAAGKIADYIMDKIHSPGYWMREEAKALLDGIAEDPDDIVQMFGKEKFDAIMTTSKTAEELVNNIASSGTAAANLIQGAASQAEKLPKGDNVEQKAKEASTQDNASSPATESHYLYYQNKDLELIYEQIAQEGMLDNIKKMGQQAGGAINKGLNTARDKMNQVAQSNAGQKVSGVARQAGSAIAGGLAKGAAAVGQAGKNLTTKVTKDKLMKTWTKSGSPTDMGSIVNIMQDAGVTPDMLQSIQDQTQIKLPGMAGQPTPQAKPAEPAAQQGATPQATTPQVKPSQQFNYAGKNKKVSGVVDKINSGGLTRDQILKYLQSKKQSA